MNNHAKQFETIIYFDNFIVRDHHVQGMRMVPGVTFIDMIYRYVADDFPDDKEIVLKNILFKEPIVVTEEFDKKVIINMRKEADFWRVIIQSQKIKDDVSLEEIMTENAECELYLEEKTQHLDMLDIVALKSSASSIVDVDIIYASARQMDIHHYEFMKTHGNIYQNEAGVLMELRLGKLAAQYADRFYIHPALLDAATFSIGAGDLISEIGSQETRKPYIPFYIQEFRAVKRAQRASYVYADRNIEIQGSGDILKNDLRAYDENGNLNFLMKGLTVKHIRSKELINRLSQLKIASAAAQIASPVSSSTISKLAKVDVDREKVDAYQDMRLRIEYNLTKMVAGILKKHVNEIKRTEGFYDLGLDSKQLLQIVRDLENRLASQLYPTLLFEYNTIQTLTDYLAQHYGLQFTRSMEETSSFLSIQSHDKDNQKQQ